MSKFEILQNKQEKNEEKLLQSEPSSSISKTCDIVIPFLSPTSLVMTYHPAYMSREQLAQMMAEFLIVLV